MSEDFEMNDLHSVAGETMGTHPIVSAFADTLGDDLTATGVAKATAKALAVVEEHLQALQAAIRPGDDA